MLATKAKALLAVNANESPNWYLITPLADLIVSDYCCARHARL